MVGNATRKYRLIWSNVSCGVFMYFERGFLGSFYFKLVRSTGLDSEGLFSLELANLRVWPKPHTQMHHPLIITSDGETDLRKCL